MNQKHVGEDNLFNKLFGKLYMFEARPLSLCRKINSKCIQYLNIRPQTLKLQEETLGKTQEDM
jgi:hypothetical protein